MSKPARIAGIAGMEGMGSHAHYALYALYALYAIYALCPAPAVAQASVATDLWRVAQGTLTSPAAINGGASAGFWTPAVVVDSAFRFRVGIDAVHAPSETGVQGGFASVAVRTTMATFMVGYGRMGIADVTYTETSPEAVGGSIPIWSQSAMLGVAVNPRRGLTAGTALRVLEGRLGPSSRSQVGLDLGAQYRVGRFRFGASTQFMDPLFGSGASGSVYSLGGEWQAPAMPMWGTPGVIAVRYGSQLQRGEAAQHLLVAAFTMGRIALDWGAAHESAYGEAGWRSRFGLGLGAGNYRVEIGRDGGRNDFGATWRFGLTADVR